ncbi:MAG: VWA domain-containing protein [Pelagimonas sp.]|jgi:hypothetical protein|nr:VWA domain-containing protein [Pelagimonas sp.]
MSKRPFWILLPLTFAAPLWAQDQPALQPVDQMIVLDASGSMWGQTDGQSKIETARSVIAGLLPQVPDTAKLGLTVYGHRRKGDCGDIETLVAPSPAAQARPQINAAVQALNPKGKTPLSAAVQQAAQALRSSENAATVILISDGKETCDADPCAVAAQLEADGIDFTTHVVGFDITDPRADAQLQCLAENTGGRYVQAANADELTGALTDVVLAPPPPADVPDLPPAPVEPYYVDGFDGDALGEEWQVLNAAPGLMQQAEGEMIMIATGERAEPWSDKALNRLMLTHPLPEGDFDLTLTFRMLPQTGRDEVVLGLISEPNTLISASLFFEQTGCGIQPLLYGTSQIAREGQGPELTEFFTKVFDVIGMTEFCQPGATKPADFIQRFGAQPADLILSKRGRSYTAKLRIQDDAGAEHLVEAAPITALRRPDHAFFTIAQRPVARGEGILFADHIAITVPADGAN